MQFKIVLFAKLTVMCREQWFIPCCLTERTPYSSEYGKVQGLDCKLMKKEPIYKKVYEHLKLQTFTPLKQNIKK